MTNSKLQNKIIEIAKKNKLTKFSERIKEIKEDKIKIKVAFLGEFSSGKSTLINALLQKKLLPMFIEPTTATITEIQKADENKVIVIENEDGEETKREISLSELAQEVTKTQTNKKIQIFRNDINFIDKNTQIIDTPGVASINETHTDITYGYLPSVDIAFILLNVNYGGANDSLINFLKKYPEEILSKIYFVLNWADTKNPEALKNIKENFINQISKIIPKPKIFIVSSKEALDGALEKDNEKYEKSGINEIKNIIKVDIPKFKSEIIKNRINEVLRNETQELKKLLEFKLKSISWDTDKLDSKIKTLKTEVSETENNINIFKNNFNQIKIDTLDKINKTIEDNIKFIGTKIAKEESFDDIVAGMTEEIEKHLEFGIKKIKGLEIENLGKNISQIISGSIDSSTMQIKEIANLISDVFTFILTAWIIPGAFNIAEAAASVATTSAKSVGKTANIIEKVANASKKAKFFKALGIFGKIISEINPLEKVRKFVLPTIVNPKIRKILSKQINEKLEIVFERLEFSMNELIEIQYLKPLQEKENLLSNSREERKQQIINIEKSSKLIKNDISDINLIINK